MKTKIKRHSRTVLSIVLTLCMLVSCMTVGMIATDAAVAVNAVTVAADLNTRGKFTVEYIDANGVTQNISSTSATQTFNAKEDTVVKVTATPNSNCNFTGWTMTGDYSRSKNTPQTAQEFWFKPSGTVTATANFEASDITGEQITSNYYIKVAKNKTDPYKINVPLYKTVNSDGANEFRSYFTIGDTDDPANGKLKAGENYWFIISSKSGNAGISDSHYNASLSIEATPNPATDWSNNCKCENQSGKYAWLVNFKSNASKATMYWGKRSSTGQLNGWFDQESGKYNTAINVTTGTAGSDDTPSTDGYTNLYVLDGIITRNNNTIQNFGTNTFGDSKIISSNSGVLKLNYYDAEDGNEFIFSNDTHSEGQRIYWYNAAENLDFRVQTTINNGHQAIGVRAFVMNGMTYPAKMSPDGVYYADITLDADSNQGVLEVIPVYYNKLIEEAGDYIKFYVDANTIGNKFGKTIGYSAWFDGKGNNGGETGGYPGQPLLSDGTLLYGYLPKYYVDNNATGLPRARDRKAFAGVLLSNLAEHNETHKDVLRAWGCSTDNYQSFDYQDPVQIANNNAEVDTIEFVAKYKELDPTHRSSYNSRELNGQKNINWPASITRPTTAADALDKGFEYLTNIDGKRVNIFNETETLTGDPLYVVSVGNQKITGNTWATVWVVYSASGKSIAAAPPVDFINPSNALQTALRDYTNSPVLINYEGWLAGENNSGTRLDGRWLYSRSSDDTTLRLRVAKEDANGNLTFMTDGITWAEINDGTHNGALEAADTNNLTKILNLGNRTTEVTAKINPVGYTVEGMYMLGAAYSDDANNGYSTKLSDYDDMNVTGTATSFVNSKDNRMVIVVKEIPATDLVITHQMYGGPGAHKIKGFYYVKAELLDSSENTVKTYNDGKYTNQPLTISSFITDAPKNSGYKLKVTIQTRMSGSASFNQWYENDHNSGYSEIDSTNAHGSTDPVEKEIIVDVDSLYGESYLSIKNLDYYSDLQAAGSVNISHLLLPETIAAGLSGSAYTQVTVVTSDGTPVTGGSYAAKERTTEVGSDFITTDNANNGCKLKVEIWTIPDSPAGFDKFYKDTTTEMSNEVDGGISYTIGQTKTFNSTSYPSATVIIPISYFFKEVYDDDQQVNVLQFDSTKQNFYLYSSLELMDFAYSFTYKYASRLYGDQTYTASDDISLAMYNSYFVYENETLKFQSAAKMQDFLAAKAPYEDNYKQTLTFDFSGYTDTSVTTFSENTISLASPITATPTDARTINVQFEFPYEYTKTTGTYDTAVTANTTTDENYKGGTAFVAEAEDTFTYQPLLERETQRGKMQYLDWVSLNTKHNSTTEATDEKPAFITAPDVIVEVSSGTFTEKAFQYWSMKDTAYNEYKKCYSKKFNMAIYQNSIIVPVYSTTSLVDDRDKTVSATLNFLEYSRNQWNNGGGNASGLEEAGASDYWLNFGDRVFTDFVLSFELNNQKLKTQNAPYRAGLLIETVGDLDTVDGELQTANAYYQTQYDELSSSDKTTIETNAKNAVSGNTTHKSSSDNYLFSYINFNQLDNKNSIEYYYAFANVNMTSANESSNNIEATTRRDKVYRAFSFIVDESGTVTVSKPVYFTIYDVATVADGETL